MQLPEGYLATGDLGYLDENDYLYVVGRASETIIPSSGVNVYPGDIEHLIKQIDGVRACAVVGVDFGQEGEYERVIALLCLKEDPRDSQATVMEQIRSHCSANIARYKWPQEYLLVDVIDHSPNGKIDRPTLVNKAREILKLPPRP